jgi:CRP-like cAMP-binding protein
MKKIILVEDNEDIRETTQEILELADYEVISAENGKLGVELVKEELPDLIICDVMMPVLDGYGVFSILSKNPKTSTIPFIFLSARSENRDLRKGMNLGADDYITKPFQESDLLTAIETRLKQSAQIKADIFSKGDSDSDLDSTSIELRKLQDLSKNRKIKKFKKKEVVYREGDYANYLYFVAKGKVKCFKSDDYGKELVHQIYSKNDFVGYMGLLEDGEYHETAVVMEETELAVIPKLEFLNLIRKNRDVSSNLIKLLARNVHDREERMLHLAYSPLRERVANALLELKEKTDETHYSIAISREDLASMVGTAKESLVRALSEFKRDELIDTVGQTITILNLEGLKKESSHRI